MDALLAELNDRQREAVCAVDGPLLILAGAGSGKTRVIAHRVARLIREGIARPEEVVAVTFTNKAAGEMKERVARLLGAEVAGAWVGTFHALCLRILRREGAILGYAPGFIVYDTADQLGLLRGLMKEAGLDDAPELARATLHRISDAKNRLQTVEELEAQAASPAAETAARCYRLYQEGLRKNNAVDFDDLILQVILMFERFTGIAGRYASACRFLLVDEYQDTNRAQYVLSRQLAGRHRNICVVGDEDQSIYSWRGADIRNILDFQKDYPDAKLIKLEQNYRSTRTILAAADGVIRRNRDRIGKTLWTDNPSGEPLELSLAPDDRAEAETVLRTIRALRREGVALEEVAVLYRTNNQSRLFEEVFLREKIPHRVVGSLRFYERREIKDLVAYLRVLLSPADDLSFARILNVPPRGLGRATLDALVAAARGEDVPLQKAAELAVERRELPPRAQRALADFLELMAGLRREAAGAGLIPSRPDLPAPSDAPPGPGPPAASGEIPATGPPAPLSPPRRRSVRDVTGLIGELMRRIGYSAWLEKSFPGDHESRLENIDALVSAAAEFDEEGTGQGLQGFVDRSSLRSDTDDVRGETGVTLLTAHSAKGLEFPVVVVTGLEEGVFPHIRSSDSRAELEEERRLLYVAMTRARRRLFLTAAASRRSFGHFVENPLSRFLDEIPGELIRTAPAVYTSFLGANSGGAWGQWSGPVSGGAASRGGPGARRAGRATRWSERAEGPYAGASAEDDYAVGMKVTHPMFGRGTIAAVEGSGPSLKLTIRFSEFGVKKILPRHTTLTIGR